ncbi:MAG: RdgB/HAM1 family non-canonical purine NTP pyrophosphatase [Candidatus Berkiella sp.]
MKIVLATENEGKLKEIQLFFKELPITLVSQREFMMPSAIESGLSFIENAILKARHASKHAKLPALADDSGIVVDALQGRPGIFSARFAGVNASDKDNLHKLLDEMKQVPAPHRGAHFYCALAFVRFAEDPAPIISQGRWDGQLLSAPIGEGGFGYDPIFYVLESACSAAQLTAAQKNMMSHRAKALALFYLQFKEYCTSNL